MKRKKFLAMALSLTLSASLATPTFAQDNAAGADTAAQAEVTEASEDTSTPTDEQVSEDEKVSEKEDASSEKTEVKEETKEEVKKEVTKETKTDKKLAEGDTIESDIDASVWTAEDFTYTDMSQTLNGCDYTRQFVVSGRAVSGLSDTGKEKIKVNKELVLPAKDEKGEKLIGVADGAFKGMELTKVTFPTGMLVDYDDTVTHKVTRRGNYIIGYDAFSNNNLTNVYLPEGVIAIMSSAFKNNQISKVTIPHTVWWIENSCFAKNQLKTVGFPKTCDFQMQIHALAFAQNNIKSVRLPDYTEVVDKRAFYSNPGMEECPAEAGEKEQSLGGVVYMYTDNANLQKVERIHTIDRTAESQKSWHQKLIVGTADPDEESWTSADFTYEGTTITGLSESGLEKRKTNKNLDLPDKNPEGQYITEIAGTTSINGLFATKEEGFDYVTFPSHLEKIGERAFMESGLTGMDSFPSTLKEIGMIAFQNNKLTSIILPDSVTKVGNGAFASNPTIKTIVISKGMTEIADSTFGCSTGTMYMTDLTEITIPDTITKIGKRAFAGNNIHDIKIPASVIEIGEYAFSTKNYLNDSCTVTLEEGLIKIGKYAFRNKVIEKIDLPSTVTSIDKNAFLKEYSDGSEAIKTIVYVNKKQYEDKENFPESDYHEYKLKIDLTDTKWDAYDFTYADAKDANIDMSALKLYSAYDPEKSVTLEDAYLITGLSENGLAKLEVNKHLVIPETDANGKQITGIAPNAFKNDGLESVTFPSGVMADVEDNIKDLAADGVTKRGNFVILASAFMNNNLTSVTLPEGVVTVANNAFKSNKNLKYISFPHTIWQIGNGAFAMGAVETVDFPENCDFKLNIDKQAFAFNKIKAVQLPKQVEKIEKYAFSANTGMEAIDANAPTAWGAKKGYGVVYMYGDESLKKETLIEHLENTDSHKSYAQKLITDEKMPEKLKPWNAGDFEYSEDGTTITGLSASGIEKRKENPDLVLPETNGEGVVITALSDSTNTTGGLFATADEKINSVILPSKLKSIGNSAFAESGITKIEFPDTLEKIGLSAFRQVNITEINLPDSVTTVGNGAFASCFNIEKIKISAGMTTIPASFVACAGSTAAEKLTELTIPEGITSIESRAFAGNNLKELVIPSTVKSIGTYAFSQVAASKNLEKITLPEGLESIAGNAFANSKIKSAILPSTVTTLDKNAFKGSDNTVILYTSDKEKLSDSANKKFIAQGVAHKTVYSNLIGTGWSYDDFAIDGTTVTGWSEQGNKTRLTNKKLVIPEINPETGEAITAIGENAFKIPDGEIEQLKDSVNSPNGMTNVVIPDTVTEIGKKAFEYNSFETIAFSENLISIGESAFHGNRLAEVTLPDTITNLGAGAFSTNNITDLTLSKGVTVIPQGAFSMNIRLEHIDIPDTVTEIGEMAFAGARLTSLDIPASVTKIGRKAFHLHHIEELTIPGTVKEIGESAFEGTFKAITLKKLTIENGVENIGKYAFKEGYLESVDIPESVTELAEDAFYGNAGTNNDHVVVVNVSNMKQYDTFKSSDCQKIVYVGEATDDCFTFDGTTVTGIKAGCEDIVLKDGTLTLPKKNADGEAITAIADKAFANAGITDVNIPNSVTTIGSGAFEGNKLTNVKVPDSIETIAKDAFAKNESQVKLTTDSPEVLEKLGKMELDGVAPVMKKVVSKNVTLSTTSYTYTGKVRKPSVKVIVDGKKVDASNYTVKYSSGRKNVGTYTVTVTMKNNYFGNVTKTFKISPKGTSLKSVKKADKKQIKVTWKKQNKQTTGYQIQYTTDKKFKKSVKLTTISKNKLTSKTIKKLKKNTKYYVRIRTYKKVGNKTYHSTWSKAKSITVK